MCFKPTLALTVITSDSSAVWRLQRQPYQGETELCSVQNSTFVSVFQIQIRLPLICTFHEQIQCEFLRTLFCKSYQQWFFCFGLHLFIFEIMQSFYKSPTLVSAGQPFSISLASTIKGSYITIALAKNMGPIFFHFPVFLIVWECSWFWICWSKWQCVGGIPSILTWNYCISSPFFFVSKSGSFFLKQNFSQPPHIGMHVKCFTPITWYALRNCIMKQGVRWW